MTERTTLGCAECGKSGGWALYCVECMDKLAHPPGTWHPLPDDTLEELLGLHCDITGNMSEADAREFAKDLGSRIKELNA